MKSIDIVKETYIIKERFGVKEQMRDLRASPLVTVFTLDGNKCVRGRTLCWPLAIETHPTLFELRVAGIHLVLKRRLL